MLFSQTTEYALRAAICLASFPDKLMKTHDIAAITDVSSGYLSKVLQALGRAGIVQSQRGLNGGFRLAAPPDTISIYQVINAVEPLSRLRTCPLGLQAHGANLCALHKKIDDVYAYVESSFKEATLGDLLHEDNSSAPLCSIPRVRNVK